MQDPVDYSLRGQFQLHHGDFMNRRERYDPQLELRGRVLPNQRVNHEPGTFDMVGYDFDLEAPVMVAPDGYLLFGAYYQGRSYNFSSAFGTNGNATGLADEKLIGTGIKLGFGVFLDDNVLLEVEAAPGAWSDMDGGLHHEDFDFPAHATFTLRAMDNLFFKVGARYNQIYEEAPYLPYLGISWEFVEGWRFDMLAPESLEFSFWPSSSTGILVGAQVTGAEYHVRTTIAAGEQRDDVQVQEVMAYLGLMHRLSDFVSFSGRAGLIVAGDYDLTSGAAGFNRVEGALDQGFFAELTMGIDF